MSFFNLFKSLFSSKTSAGLPPVRFYKDAIHFPEHGRITVTHHTLKVRDLDVQFAFEGMSTPPALNPTSLNYIFEQAKAQGYIPYEIISYQMVKAAASTIDA